MHETEEIAPLLDGSHEPGGESGSQSATTAKVPEVEIHLFLTEKSPELFLPEKPPNLIDVFKWNLGGEEQDQLEFAPILDKYGLKTIFAYAVDNDRGFCVPIRFNLSNGRSLLTHRDGTVVHIIANRKNRVIHAIQIIVVGAVFAMLYNSLLNPTAWIYIPNLPLWVVMCIYIVLRQVRTRRRYIYRMLGWC